MDTDLQQTAQTFAELAQQGQWYRVEISRTRIGHCVLWPTGTARTTTWVTPADSPEGCRTKSATRLQDPGVWVDLPEAPSNLSILVHALRDADLTSLIIERCLVPAPSPGHAQYRVRFGDLPVDVSPAILIKVANRR